MHLKSIRLDPGLYPDHSCYPYNLPVLQRAFELKLITPVTFFIGENGTGKSTILKAIAGRCNIHIWEDNERRHYRNNPHETLLHQALSIEWTDGSVQGSYFGSQIFNDFIRRLDDWASANPGILEYFGGDSLRTQSHGQSLLAFFRSRYQRKGLYLLDEPETALSPGSQLALLELIAEMGRRGHAQFIIASHSPLLMACPDARIISFDHAIPQEMAYEDTEYFRVYRNFLNSRKKSSSAEPV